MTDEQKAAFVMAQAALLNARVAGMVAQNQFRMSYDNSISYDENAFIAVEREFDSVLGHNAVLVLFG